MEDVCGDAGVRGLTYVGDAGRSGRGAAGLCVGIKGGAGVGVSSWGLGGALRGGSCLFGGGRLLTRGSSGGLSMGLGLRDGPIPTGAIEGFPCKPRYRSRSDMQYAACRGQEE